MRAALLLNRSVGSGASASSILLYRDVVYAYATLTVDGGENKDCAGRVREDGAGFGTLHGTIKMLAMDGHASAVAAARSCAKQVSLSV